MSKYEVKNRVILPGTFGVQAVILDVVDSVMGFPVYTLRWLTTDGEAQTGSCGEQDLSIFNMTFAEREAEAAARHKAEQAIERRVTALVAAKLRARKLRNRKLRNRKR